MNVVFTMCLTVGLFVLLSIIAGPLLMRDFGPDVSLCASFC